MCVCGVDGGNQKASADTGKGKRDMGTRISSIPCVQEFSAVHHRTVYLYPQSNHFVSIFIF